MPDEFRNALDNLVASKKIVVFMKGTKQFPQCGFSNTVVQVILSTCDLLFLILDADSE